MPNYFLQLGHAPELSFAEISAVHGRLALGGELLHAGDIAWLKADTLDSALSLCRELGGTIRLCETLAQQSLNLNGEDAAERLSAWLAEAGVIQRLREHKRPSFGISFLGQLSNERALNALLSALAQRIKERLREEETSSRFVLPGERLQLNAAQVDKNRLLTHGAEIVLHIGRNQDLTLGVTRWLQEYEEFSQRDYGRPQRDVRSGMLPPKLCRMLINLARTSPTRTLLDPFCGSGSLIQEAALMGLEATGVDNSEKAIRDSIANWKWMRQQLPAIPGTMSALPGDARQLHRVCPPLHFDACVTEPYLGPPLRKPLTREQFQKVSKELTDLYLRSLAEIRTVVKPGARVVFILPRFRLEDSRETSQLNLLSVLKLQGYRVLDPLNHFTPAAARATLLYARPQQWVQREIFVLQA